MRDENHSQPRSVLVVDSDPAVLALLTSILEGPRTASRPRIRVLRARSAAEAAEVLDRSYVPVDLILANQKFSESGELGSHARAIRPEVPVMYLSALSEGETVRLPDPSSAGEGLLGAVVAALGKPAMRVAGHS
jgi:CheY-like chemotaxis protein